MAMLNGQMVYLKYWIIVRIKKPIHPQYLYRGLCVPISGVPEWLVMRPTQRLSTQLTWWIYVNIYIYNYQQLMAPDSRNMQKPIYQISDSLGCKPSENSGVHGLNRFNYGYQSKQLMAVIQCSTLSNNYKLIIHDYISPQQLELEL